MPRILFAFLATAILLPAPSQARVVKLVVERTEATGAYTKLTGHFEGELDPKLPLNAIIQDLQLAPRNSRGRVECSATFTLLFPADPAKRSGLLLYEVPNRGNSPLRARQAPLGTYLGWNATAAGYLKRRGCGFAGGMIPFARTKAEREASADPRPSLEERYSTHENYVAKVKAAAQQLVKDRFLVQEDADRLISQAEASNVLR